MTIGPPREERQAVDVAVGVDDRVIGLNLHSGCWSHIDDRWAVGILVWNNHLDGNIVVCVIVRYLYCSLEYY